MRRAGPVVRSLYLHSTCGGYFMCRELRLERISLASAPSDPKHVQGVHTGPDQAGGHLQLNDPILQILRGGKQPPKLVDACITRAQQAASLQQAGCQGVHTGLISSNLSPTRVQGVHSGED